MMTIEVVAVEQFPYNEDEFSWVTERDRHAFAMGIAIAQRWIPIEEELPEAFDRGDWFGKRSEFVLAKDGWDDWHKAMCYIGNEDEFDSHSWVDVKNDKLLGIVSWRPLELR